MFGYLFFPLTASECFCYTFYLLFITLCCLWMVVAAFVTRLASSFGLKLPLDASVTRFLDSVTRFATPGRSGRLFYTFYILYLRLLPLAVSVTRFIHYVVRFAGCGWLWLPLLHVWLPLLASSCHWTHLLHVFSTLLHVLLLLDDVAASFTGFTSSSRL